MVPTHVDQQNRIEDPNMSTHDQSLLTTDKVKNHAEQNTVSSTKVAWEMDVDTQKYEVRATSITLQKDQVQVDKHLNLKLQTLKPLEENMGNTCRTYVQEGDMGSTCGTHAQEGLPEQDSTCQGIKANN